MLLGLFSVAIVLISAGVLYLICRFRRLSPVRRIAERSRLLAWIAAALPVAAVGCFAWINLTTMLVVFLHLVFFWLAADLIAAIAGKVRHRLLSRDATAAAVLIFTVIYLGFGWFLGHHIYRTNYVLSTEKQLPGGSLRIVEIADAHLGITVDGARFARQIERIEREEPDVVVIVGDFVDDDTDRADMLQACRALGTLHTTYGVYFVYGNHDNGYFTYRNFSAADLRTALEENNVTILSDESVLLGDSFYLTGRRDRSAADRMTADELTRQLDADRYEILLDHQPNDYDAEAAAGVDLVLSGHTHGGHILPAGMIGLAIGANDQVYGIAQRAETTFVVTSGLSGWAIPFKTGAICEYVVIDIQTDPEKGGGQ